MRIIPHLNRYISSVFCKTPPKIAVYTAIFGGYDTPPDVSNPDTNIQYILFTDQEQTEAKLPWKVRMVHRIFKDSQLDARRVKLLPHLFLPEFEYSVWIDGNVELLTLNTLKIKQYLKNAIIALPYHPDRSCIYEEAKVILELKYDSQIRVNRQIEYYHQQGFPEFFGLHTTMILIRQHNLKLCRKFNESWWSLVYTYSKRDQMSFDYLRWKLNPQINTLPLDCRNNEVFIWGRNKITGRGHFLKHNKIHSDEIHELFTENIQFPFFAEAYSLACDKWGQQFLLNLRALNHILSETMISIDLSLIYFPECQNYLYSSPDPRKSNSISNFLQAIKNKHHLLEINLNTGHSALLALGTTSIKCTSIVQSISDSTNRIAAFLRSKYQKRFLFRFTDPQDMLNHRETFNFNQFDVFHFNGIISKEVYLTFILAILHCGNCGSEVIIDEYSNGEISEINDGLISKGFLKQVEHSHTKKPTVFRIIELFPWCDDLQFQLQVKQFIQENENNL